MALGFGIVQKHPSFVHNEPTMVDQRCAYAPHRSRFLSVLQSINEKARGFTVLPVRAPQNSGAESSFKGFY